MLLHSKGVTPSMVADEHKKAPQYKTEFPMRRLSIPALLILAACSTPQERCIGEANRDLRVINGLVIETRGNIARGFAIREVQDVITVTKTCTGETPEGVEFKFKCPKTETVTRREPLAIDLNAEKAKLASLEERQLQLQANQASAVAQCRAQFPE